MLMKEVKIISKANANTAQTGYESWNLGFSMFNDTQYKICEADCSLKSNPELIFVKCHTKMNIVASICITQTCAQIYDIRLVRVIGISVQVHFSGCLGIELFGITGLV